MDHPKDDPKGYWNESIETMSRDELRQLQDRRLGTQFPYVYRHSPFYRKKFEREGIRPKDIRSQEDLQKIPPTTKDEMREAIIEFGNPFPHLCAPMERIVGFGPSRGTTGDPTFYALTKRDLDHRVEWMARSFYQIGLRPKMHLHSMMAIQRLTHFIMKGATERIGGIYVNDGVDNPPISIQIGRWLRPPIILTGIRNLLTMERILREEEEYKPKDVFDYRIIILYGDVLGKSTVDHVKDLWGAKEVFNLSGSAADLFWLNFDCEEHLGNHCLNEDMFVIEVVDPETGRNVGSGERGELVVTDLCTKGTPHIRWNVEDMVIPYYESCPCGRSHVRLRYLGRSLYRVTIQGKTVMPIEIEDILWKFPQLAGAEFRIVKYAHRMDRLRLQMEYPQKGAPESLRKDLKEEVKNTLGVDSEIEFVSSQKLQIMDTKALRILDLTQGT